jgi:hypothetical protein
VSEAPRKCPLCGAVDHEQVAYGGLVVLGCPRVPESGPTVLWTDHEARALCHSLDAAGRPLCGADLTGTRAAHPIGDCVADGHPRCAACDSLMEIDGDDPALAEGA